MSKELEQTTIKKGGQFVVCLWGDKAIKYPQISSMTEDQLRMIVEHQNNLAEIKGIPKADFANGVIVEDRVPGETWDDLNRRGKLSQAEVDYIEKEQDRILSEIDAKGYHLGDRNKTNLMYCKKTKTVSLIDFYDIRFRKSNRYLWKQ